MLGNPRLDEIQEQPVEPAADRLWRLAAIVGAACEAVREGLVARRRYEHLRSTGVRHDAALRTALGVSHGPAARHCANQESTGGSHV
jgi:hypothetical protein